LPVAWWPAVQFGPEEFDKVAAIALPEKIKRAAFVVAISSYCKSQLSRWCDYDAWSKINIVRCGVDDMFLKGERVPVSDEPHFVTVGRFAPEKGQAILIEAAGRLLAEGIDFKLTIIGDGPLRDRLEHQIRQKGLTENVKITGWVDGVTVRKLMLSSRFLVLPSFAEGLSVVLMEVLALRRPAICTAIAGLPELVEQGKSGWVVPAGSVEDLYEALKCALCTTLEEIGRMGDVGFESVRQRHCVSSEAERLIGLFESCAD
jgi:glycosyltransferase involved in cell wall biosynthesis